MAELLNTKTLDTMSLSTYVASAADISTFVNTTASDTLGGAKTYTDAEISALSADFNARIAALEGFTSFIGVKDSLPETAEDGQICIVGNKEYIYGSKVDGSVGWTELGDTTAETAAIEELSNAVAALETTKANASDVNASVEALTSAINDVEASLSGYDTVGSAAAAQEAAVAAAKAYTDDQDNKLYATVANNIGETAHNLSTDYINRIDSTTSTFVNGINAAKAYTDEQITAVEGEISSLTDVVDTKADKATVNAAISEINDSISALSAKAEEDPVFTAWKDGESIALGSGSIAGDEVAVAIGTNSQGLGYKAVAIGGSASLTGEYSIAIGGDTHSEFGGIAIGGQAATYTNAIAIGLSAYAGESNGVAIGNNAKSHRLDGIAIGLNAQSGLSGNRDSDGEFGVVQIGSTNDNDQPVTSKDPILKVFKHEVLNANGKITTANLAGIDTLKTAVSAIEEVTAEDNVQALREAVNTLVAAIKTFVGA